SNDAAAATLLSKAASDVVGPAGVRPIARPSMGSEDFACYLEKRPGAMARLGVASDHNATTPLHTAKFDITEKPLPIGVRTLCHAVVLGRRPDGTSGGT